jgi:LysR family transcriptional regulator, hydrogen peroxide-inducible genes activator
MNIKQVRYFLTICEERHFTRAAKRCDVSQPSLTAAIQRLEREIGGKLFVRSTPVELSALGKALRPLFLRMRDTAERAQRIAASHAPAPRSRISVGAPARY